MISHCDFDFHFPDACDVGHIYIYLIGHLHIFFGNMSIQILCSFLNCVIFVIDLYEFYNFE